MNALTLWEAIQAVREGTQKANSDDYNAIFCIERFDEEDLLFVPLNDDCAVTSEAKRRNIVTTQPLLLSPSVFTAKTYQVLPCDTAPEFHTS